MSQMVLFAMLGLFKRGNSLKCDIGVQMYYFVLLSWQEIVPLVPYPLDVLQNNRHLQYLYSKGIVKMSRQRDKKPVCNICRLSKAITRCLHCNEPLCHSATCYKDGYCIECFLTGKYKLEEK